APNFPQDFQLGIGAWTDASTFGRETVNLTLSNLVVTGTVVATNSSPCNPHEATATATVVNGFVVGATITDGGCGYTNAPIVLIQGGGGTGATATAIVSNGVVTGVTITDAGSGYTSTPAISVYSPLALQVNLMKAVRPWFSNLSPGFSYQLQI